MTSFGGAIKLTGESTYRAALRNITQNLKEVSSEMKLVASQYDKGDTSTEALSAKSEVLNKKLEQQKSKLATLQAQYGKMSSEYQTQTANHDKLVQSYKEEQEKLDKIGQELGETSPEYQKQKDVVAKLSKEVESSSKAQEANANTMSRMRTQINNAATDINKTKAEISGLDSQMDKASASADDLGDSMGETKGGADKLGNAVEDAGKKAENAGNGGFTVLKGALANLAGNVIQSAISGIQGLVGDALDSSDALKKFESTMSFAGYDDSQIQTARDAMKDYADKTVYDLNTISNTTAQLAANGIDDYTGLTEAAGNLNAVAGGNADTFQSVAMVLTQTAGAGKLTTENWNQMADAIPGASGKLQEALLTNGAYTGNFRDALEKGEITADEFNQAIMDLGFTDAAQEAATSTDTFEGAMGNMEAAVTDGLMQIYDAIGSENVTNFISGISDAVSEIIPYIKDAIQWLKDNLPTIAPLLATIAAGLGALMVAQQIDAMVQAFQKWKTATEGLTVAQRILNAVQLSSPIGIIIAAIAALVAGIVVLWNTNEDFRNAVTNIWEGIKETFSNVVEAIATFFTQTIPEAFTTALDAVTGWFESVGEWFEGLGETLAQLPGQFAEWLGGVIAAVGEWAANLAQSALDAGSQFVSNVVSFVQNLPYNIGYILGTVIGTVASWVIEFAQNAQQAGTQFLNNVVNFVQQLPGNIANFLSNIISNVATWVSNMAENARQAGTQFINNVISFIQQLPGRVASFLSNIISNVVGWASNMASNARNAGSQFLSNVVNYLTQLPGRVAGFLSDVIGRLASWVGEMASKGAEGARSMFDAVVDGISSLPGRVASIGGDIVHGIWNGISGAAGWLADKVSSFASGILDGMKSALGIASPSKLFRDQVGRYIAQGIGVGFENEMGNVTRQMQDAMPDASGFVTGIGGVSATSGLSGASGALAGSSVVDAIVEALGRVHVVLDDEVAGKFVERTVTNAIYA
jgi:tape measure domain-containing protein